MKNFIFGMFAMILVASVGFAAYQYGKSSGQVGSNNRIPTVIPSVEITVSPTQPLVDNDNDLIKQALFKKNNWKESDGITVTVSSNDDKYAKGGVTAQGGGGYFFAAKVNGVWEIVADGNGVILCSALEKYPDYPKTFIPECWDDVKKINVKR